VHAVIDSTANLVLFLVRLKVLTFIIEVVDIMPGVWVEFFAAAGGAFLMLAGVVLVKLEIQT
jgi:hypothetical protein